MLIFLQKPWPISRKTLSTRNKRADELTRAPCAWFILFLDHRVHGIVNRLWFRCSTDEDSVRLHVPSGFFTVTKVCSPSRSTETKLQVQSQPAITKSVRGVLRNPFGSLDSSMIQPPCVRRPTSRAWDSRNPFPSRKLLDHTPSVTEQASRPAIQPTPPLEVCFPLQVRSKLASCHRHSSARSAL